MAGFSQVLWASRSFQQILSTVGVLSGITAGVMAVAVWWFDRGPVFDQSVAVGGSGFSDDAC